MSQVRILSPRPKTKPVRWAGFVFGLGSRVRACEAGSAEAPAQATPERRPVGRAKRVNPVAPIEKKAGFEPAKQVQPKRQRRQRRNGACRPRQTSENTSFSA